MTASNSQQRAPTQPASAPPVAVVAERNIFYYDAFQRSTRLCAILAFALIGSLVFNAVQFVWRPAPSYFAVNPAGELVKLEPLDRPYVSNHKVASFARDAALLALAFDFANYRAQLNEASRNFTGDGWQSYLDALDRRGTIQRIEKEQLVSVPVPTGPATIAAASIVNGVYRWEVHQPVQVALQGRGGVTLPTKALLVVTVDRVDPRERPEGIAVARLQAITS